MKSPLFRIPEKFLHSVQSLSQPPLCFVCKTPVPLETAKTDERGAAIHEECYLLKVKVQRESAST
jgi:hypothetical protein